jgi:cytochrome b561/polyisoprenoid-binding protein YceI
VTEHEALGSDIRTASIQVRSRYSRGSIILHWLTAAAFAVQLGLGWRMDAAPGPQTFAVFQLHKSIGITILVLTLARIIWRLSHPAPPFANGLKAWERALARGVHFSFYAILLLMPLSGWLIVSTSRMHIPTVLFGVIPWPHLPVPQSGAAASNAIAGGVHSALAVLAVTLIGLHVLGALKHQFLDRDDELGRMIPVARRALPALGLTAVAAMLGLLVLGRTLHLAPIARAPTSVAAGPVAPAAAKQSVAQAATEAVAQPEDPSTEGAEGDVIEPAPPVAQPSAPSKWRLASGSSIGFQSAWSQGPIDGSFRRFTADITFDPDKLDASSASVTVDMSSVHAGNSEQQSALPSAEWFAIGAYPEAVFIAKRFTHLGGDRYRADGTLRLRGTSRPQALTFTVKISGDSARVSGKATIDRVAFGVGQGEWSSTADIPANVTLSIALHATRIRPTGGKP